MAGRPIDIEIGINADNVNQGTDRVVDGLDDIQDSLRDVDRTSERTADNMADGMSDAGRQIRRDLTQALDDVADEARTTGTSVSRSLDNAGDSAGSGMRRGTREASEGLQDLRSEAAGTAAETAASFDGSASSIAGAFQEVSANAFGGFGPAGAAAGLAAAAGIGIATSAMEGLATENNETMTAIGDLARAIYDAGGQLDEADIAKKIKDIAFAFANEDNQWTFWANEAKTGIRVVREAAEGLDEDLRKDFFKGLGGDAVAAARSMGVLQKAIEADNKELENHYETSARGHVTYTDEGKAIQDRIKKREELIGKMEKSSGVERGAAEDAKYYTEAMGDSTDAAEKQAEAEDKAREAQEKRLEIQNKLGESNRNVTESENAWYDSLRDGNTVIAENGRTVDMLTEAGRKNREAVVGQADAGNQLLDSYYAQGMSADELARKVAGVKDSFIAQAEAAGYSRTEAEQLYTAYGTVPAEVLTKIKTEGGPEAQAAIEGIPVEKDTTVKIKPEGQEETQGAVDAVEGKEVGVEVSDDGTSDATQDRISGVTGKEVKIDVDDDYTVSEVQKRINGITGKDVYINVKIGNAGEFAREMAALTANRSMTITVNKQIGTESGV